MGHVAAKNPAILEPRARRIRMVPLRALAEPAVLRRVARRHGVRAAEVHDHGEETLRPASASRRARIRSATARTRRFRSN